MWLRLYYCQAMDPKFTDKFLEVVSAAATPDSSDPQTILHRAYNAIIQGDFNSFGESLADDVELHICGLGALDGTWRGREDVLAATRRNFAAVADQKPEVEGMISQGDSVAVLLRESGMFKSSGQTYSVRGVQWFTFAGGKIRKIDEIVASIWKVES
jgi:ketosteroid isomerase-like protein